MMVPAAILVIAWGSLAFGAVYPWAYWPLFAVAGAAGIAGLSIGARRQAFQWPLTSAVAAVLLAIALQVLPLPKALIAAISPNSDRLLGQLDVAYTAGVIATHPLSIEPLATTGRLLELIAFALFVLGLSQALTPRRAQRLANGIITLGVVVALVGIVQKAAGSDRIYGFWSPADRAFQMFGPFVNRNHFAGWMLMPLGVAVGLLCGRTTTAMSGAESDWRSRVIWWSSPEASQLLLTAGAIVVMVFSIVLTRSRSGNACLAVVMILAVLAVIARAHAAGRLRRGAAAVAVIGLLAAGAATWAGTEPLVARLHNDPPLNGRMNAWRAAARIASDFPIAGTGLNTFSTAMLFYQLPPLRPRWEFAHNDYLQLLAEGGVLVCVPSLVCVVLIAVTAVRRLGTRQPDLTRWIRLGAAIGLVAIGFQEFVDFSLQLPGISALFSVLIAFTLFPAGTD